LHKLVEILRCQFTVIFRLLMTSLIRSVICK
jgi:hypothetical protein